MDPRKPGDPRPNKPWDEYYEAHDAWSTKRDAEAHAKWEQYVDFSDVSLLLVNVAGPEIDKAWQVISEVGLNAPDSALDFAKAFLANLKAPFDEDALKELVLRRHGDEMESDWEDDNPEPLDPDEAAEEAKDEAADLARDPLLAKGGD